MSERPRSGACRRGFSLIELMVVVVIVGLLASIAVPAYQDAQREAYRAVVLADLNAVKQAIEGYRTTIGGLPDQQELEDAGFTLSPGVYFDKFDLKDADAPDARIHIHIAHQASHQYYHIEYPTDPEPELRWKK